MLTFPKDPPWLRDGPADLVSQAAAILGREAPVLPLMPQLPGVSSSPFAAFSEFANRACPVTGATVPLPSADKAQIQQQAHELAAQLFAAFGQASPMGGGATSKAYAPNAAQDYSGRKCPVTHAGIPVGDFGTEELRRKVHEFIETLLGAFTGATGEASPSAEGRVPHIHCAAPVRAGSVAHASFTVTNEDVAPAEVALYSTNFVAENGHEFPSICVTATPRVHTISARGQARFEIQIAVPQQSGPGTYSGLIQVMGSKYVKAVLSVEVE